MQALGGEAEVPTGGYVGSYVMDLAKEIVAEEGERFLAMSQEDALRELGRVARGEDGRAYKGRPAPDKG